MRRREKPIALLLNKLGPAPQSNPMTNIHQIGVALDCFLEPGPACHEIYCIFSVNTEDICIKKNWCWFSFVDVVLT